MSDSFQEKTEEATPKKLADTRKKGQVAKSQDLNTGGLLFVGILAMFFFLRTCIACLYPLQSEFLPTSTSHTHKQIV
jgi:flagellar biosynthesis protein FlhB